MLALRGTADNLLIVVDSIGDVQWSKTYNGGFGDVTHHVLQTSDKGFLIGGEKWNPNNNSVDLTLIKLDDTGKVQWARGYGGSIYSSAQYIQQTTDGGYIVVGSANGTGIVTDALFLLKIDNLGLVQWAKTYNANGEIGRFVLEIPTGGFLIAGGGDLFTSNQQTGLLMLTDSAGTPITAQTYATDVPGSFNRIQRTADGGYLIEGQRSPSPNGDIYDGIYLVKVDSLLQVEWSKTYDDSFIVGSAPVIQKTFDGNYILGADVLDANGSSDILTIKIDALGHVIRSNVTGRAGADFINCVLQTNDSGFALLGTTNDTANTPRSAYFIKADTTGNSCFTSTAQPSVIDVTTVVGNLSFTQAIFDSSEVINLTVGGGATQSILCMDTISTAIQETPPESWVSVFPNPAYDHIFLQAANAPYTIEIVNMLGEKVCSATVLDKNITLDLSDKPKGLYLYMMCRGTTKFYGKLLLR